MNQNSKIILGTFLTALGGLLFLTLLCQATPNRSSVDEVSEQVTNSSSATDNSYDSLYEQCLYTDPNPFLVQLRKQSEISPSSRLLLQDTCEEISKQLVNK